LAILQTTEYYTGPRRTWWWCLCSCRAQVTCLSQRAPWDPPLCDSCCR
jgi:hypothetical protein